MKAAEQQSLTREQKEAVGLLSIGTFLEYFDLMLYVHMAVLLNELFFPETDSHTQSLVAVFAFSSSYLLRPFGALLFGYIGDKIGRKSTVVITTLMMSISSLMMYCMPTYAQIGIAASWLVTFCRIIQGMSSLGEFVGAQLYLTELIKPPKQYLAVNIITEMTGVGTLFALGIATVILKLGFDWRNAFLFGCVIALIGYVARTTLRESPDFLEAKKQAVANKILYFNDLSKDHYERINKKIIYSYFFIELGNPVWIYLVYIYYGIFLKQHLEYSAVDVIQHNFYLSIWGLILGIIALFLVTKIHPLQIMQIKLIIFCIFLPFFIWTLEQEITVFNVVMLQIFVKTFCPTASPSHSVIFTHFPILRRFTAVSILYALSRALMYSVTSVGIVFLTDNFGVYGLLFVIIPIVIGYSYGLNTFIQLEREVGTYHKKNFWNIAFLKKNVYQA